MSEVLGMPPEFDYSNPSWKTELTLSHYDLEREKQMLLYRVERCLDNAGVDNPLVNEFLKTEHDRIIKCLSENPINFEKTNNLTQVPNSEENPATGLKSANT